MFRGLRRTALAILTLALILTFPVTASATDAGFSDVPETAPYHDSVVYLSERQIVTGTGVGQFSPDAPITVRQWAVMLCRAYGVQMKGNGWMEQSQSGVDAAYGNGWLSETAVVSPETQLCRSAVLESAFDAAQIPVYDNEFGHFIEGELLSFPARSQELFNAEAKDAPFRSYAKTSSNEYFADYFAYLLTHSDGSKSMQLLKKSTPKTYEYFHSLTINGEPLLGGSHAEEVKNY